MFDAVVVGAGPGGSAAARLLAQAGWKIALVEKSTFPRRKVCGEFISATSLPVLEACGIAGEFLAAAGPPVTRVGLYAGATMLSSRQEHMWGQALGREHLDRLLRDAAVRAGAEQRCVRRSGGGMAGGAQRAAVVLPSRKAPPRRFLRRAALS